MNEDAMIQSVVGQYLTYDQALFLHQEFNVKICREYLDFSGVNNWEELFHVYVLSAVERFIWDCSQNKLLNIDLKWLPQMSHLNHLSLGCISFPYEQLACIPESVTMLDLANTGIEDADLIHLQHSHITSLHVSSANINGSGFVYLKDIPLKFLSLTKTQMTDASLTCIRHWRLEGLAFKGTRVSRLDALKDLPLTSLNLCRTRVNNAALTAIAHLPLGYLALDSTLITDDGLKFLPRTLHTISLDRNRVTDMGMKELRNLPLENVSLVLTGVGDAGLIHLSGLKLTALSICQTHVTNAGLKHLSQMPLKRLLISQTEITDVGLSYLSGLSLIALDLSSTRVSVDGLSFLTGMPLVQLNIRGTSISEDQARAILGGTVKISV